VNAPSWGKWSTNDANYLTEFFSEKPSQSLGTLVGVAAGTNPQNIDFTLTTGFTISGKITSVITGQGLMNVQVMALNVTTGEIVSYSITSADGTYTIRGLPAGNYYIWAIGTLYTSYNDKYYLNALDISTATPVQVGNSNVTGINISLMPK
jgi:hypothetical protein